MKWLLGCLADEEADEEDRKDEEDEQDGEKEEEKQTLSPALIAGLSLLGIGIVLLVIPSLVLNIRHPAAFVEREIAGAII